jgi:4'-phosphopantetheinyl transferase
MSCASIAGHPTAPPPPGAVHVWVIGLDLPQGTVRALGSTLDSGERLRCERFASVLLRDRFVVAHAALREILSLYIGTPAQALPLTRTASGKPVVAGAPLAFSLAHSQDLALCAVTALGRIGVDVEAVRHVPDADDLVCRYFSPDEARRYLALPETARPRAFLTLWTLKEAFVKATGEGLSRPLDSYSVSVDLASAQVLDAGEREDTSRWCLRSLEPKRGYAGALACDGPVVSLTQFTWTGQPSRDGYAPAAAKRVPGGQAGTGGTGEAAAR